MEPIMIEDLTEEALKNAITQFTIRFAAKCGEGSGTKAASAVLNSVANSFEDIAYCICGKGTEGQKLWKEFSAKVYQSQFNL